MIPFRVSLTVPPGLEDSQWSPQHGHGMVAALLGSHVPSRLLEAGIHTHLSNYTFLFTLTFLYLSLRSYQNANSFPPFHGLQRTLDRVGQQPTNFGLLVKQQYCPHTEVNLGEPTNVTSHRPLLLTGCEQSLGQSRAP